MYAPEVVAMCRFDRASDASVRLASEKGLVVVAVLVQRLVYQELQQLMLVEVVALLIIPEQEDLVALEVEEPVLIILEELQLQEQLTQAVVAVEVTQLLGMLVAQA